MNFILFYLLSIYRAQQPPSGWPSNVFRRFVVGKASTIGIEILSILPLIFTGVKKCEIWRRFKHHLTLSRYVWKRSKKQDISTLKQISCVGMIALCLCQVWWTWVHAPLVTVSQSCPAPPLLKIAWRKRAKSSITQPWIIQFRSNFVPNLNAWHSKCCKSSRSRGQKSKSQRDISALKSYNLGTDTLLKVKLGQNYPRGERNM